MKRKCSECNRKRDRCIPAVKHIDGTIDYICPQCWRVLDFNLYMYDHHKPG